MSGPDATPKHRRSVFLIPRSLGITHWRFDGRPDLLSDRHRVCYPELPKGSVPELEVPKPASSHPAWECLLPIAMETFSILTRPLPPSRIRARKDLCPPP